MSRRLVLFCMVCACGGGQVAVVEETSLTPPPQSAEPATVEAPPTEAIPVETTSSPAEGQISRGDLKRVLGNGPGGVLALVRTEPARSAGRFLGFRIAEFLQGAPTQVDLRVGDVVVAVNGQAIVSPDDFFKVFQELQVASELRFDILREGAPTLLVYAIVD